MSLVKRPPAIAGLDAPTIPLTPPVKYPSPPPVTLPLVWKGVVATASFKI